MHWARPKSLPFGRDSDTIGLHLRNVYRERELEEAATAEHFSVVQREGERQVQRPLTLYNLDATISVGYRVNFPPLTPGFARAII